jgi:8-oxo-dGTP diphosphatase
MTIITERHRPKVLDEEREFLQGYDAGAFPHVAVTADVVLLTLREGRLSVLLINRAGPPFQGHWALPGGFVREGEDLEAAAARELSEETRLSLRRMHATLEQLRTYSTPDRDPRMWVVSTAFVALVSGVGGPRAGGDAADARFWAIEELTAPGGPWLAFDHHLIISDAIEWARERIETTAVAASLLAQPFSLSQLRGVYETVWGVRLDPANFRRKVLSTPGFVETTGRRTAPEGGGRPAELYHQGTTTKLELPLRRPLEREAAASAKWSQTVPPKPDRRGRKIPGAKP